MIIAEISRWISKSGENPLDDRGGEGSAGFKILISFNGRLGTWHLLFYFTFVLVAFTFIILTLVSILSAVHNVVRFSSCCCCCCCRGRTADVHSYSAENKIDEEREKALSLGLRRSYKGRTIGHFLFWQTNLLKTTTTELVVHGLLHDWTTTESARVVIPIHDIPIYSAARYHREPVQRRTRHILIPPEPKPTNKTDAQNADSNHPHALEPLSPTHFSPTISRRTDSTLHLWPPILRLTMRQAVRRAGRLHASRDITDLLDLFLLGHETRSLQSGWHRGC